MSLILGIDLGTTKVTAIAADAGTGAVVASTTESTCGNTTSAQDRKRGRSEWNASAILKSGFDCLTRLTVQLGDHAGDIVSLGVTGQQHGMVLVDARHQPIAPFINWQDQRGNDPIAGQQVSWIEAARERLGADAVFRTGCQLNTGFLATTLFWMNEHSQLPDGASACFIMDLFVATLTGAALVTDPTVAGSAGVLNVSTRNWDQQAIAALGLRPCMFPTVREADHPFGRLRPEFSTAIGLPTDLPISIPIGDHQASFLGTIADIRHGLLLNVGTGAQVAVFTEANDFAPPIELRPFPIRGNLLSNVGLTGGWSLQVIENFVRQLGVDLYGASSETPVYERLSQLAAQAAPDCAGLTCIPTFSGTRANPDQTGSILRATPRNFTPANFARAVLNGMARNYREAWEQITAVTGVRATAPQLAGAGNGLRENPTLIRAVSSEFGATPVFTRHREEAAFGAALVGGVAAGVFESLDTAAKLVRYQ